MKIAGMLLSLLVILTILPSLGLTFAAPSISIETSQSVYEYGDHLVMIINVSEITEMMHLFTSLTQQKEKVYSYNNQFPLPSMHYHQTFLLILLYGNLAYMYSNLNIQESIPQYSLLLKKQERLDYRSG